MFVSKRCDEEANLSQQDNPLPIRPNDMVHLRANSLPGQLGGAQARLSRMRTSIASASFSVRNILMGVPCALVCAGGSLPRRSPCLSGPCCTRWSRFSSCPAGLWSPRSCSLQRNHDQSPPIEDASGSHRNVSLRERFPRSTVGRAVTSARDDDIKLTDDLVQLDHSESIHAEANEEGRRG